MAITFDPIKNARNVAERNLPFNLVEFIDWETAIIRPDTRRDYGEVRLRILALLDGRLHTAIVSPRDDDLRVISFRKANKREVREYAESQL